MTRHVLDVTDMSPDELRVVLALAERQPESLPRSLQGRGVALVFEKPSARTRNSSELAVVALGGHPVYIQGSEVAIDRRESASDVARTLACYHAIIAARVADHGTLARMAAALDGAGVAVPVVNLLSDRAHPCQALADLLTLRQILAAGRHPADLTGRTLAYVGDANNVWRSLAAACAMAGMATRVASPPGYGPDEDDVAVIAGLGGELVVTDDPVEAVQGVDAIYTDVWISMGQEEQADLRRRVFRPYSVTEKLLEGAAGDAVVLHCLPAHRGEEIAAEVLDGPRSAVWRQAANRMHAMRGLLAWMADDGPSTGAVEGVLG